MQKFMVYIEQDEDGRYVGTIPVLPSCYAEGETLAEMMENLTEVARLSARNLENHNPAKFVGIQSLEFSHA